MRRSGWAARFLLGACLLQALPARADELCSLPELAEIACSRSRLVVINEVQQGALWMARSRRVGQQLLPNLHQHGVRYLAMEALLPEWAERANARRQLPARSAASGSPLDQNDLRSMMQIALDLGWKLLPYETTGDDYRARRGWFLGPLSHANLPGESWNHFWEYNEAQNLTSHLDQLPTDARMLVWCSNSHLYKQPSLPDLALGWRPEANWSMAAHLGKLTGLEPFCIDQTPTADWPEAGTSPEGVELLQHYGQRLSQLPQRTGALLRPRGSKVDALILSLDNTFGAPGQRNERSSTRGRSERLGSN